MKFTDLELKIADIVRPVVADEGFELFCVKIQSENGAQILQIMAEDPTTKRLGVEDCKIISKAVSAILDVEDPINSAYRLEVSSPGIDRFLLNAEHFEAYTGFDAKIESTMPAENGQRKFRGRLGGLNDNKVLIQTDQGDAEIPLGDISKAKLVMSDELIKLTQPQQEDKNGTDTSC